MNPQPGMTPSRGDVVMVNLDPKVDHEEGGQQPALVVSVDQMNRSPAGMIVIAPITGTDRNTPAYVRVAVPEGGLTKASVVMVDQIRTVSRLRIARRLGAVSPSTMGQVEHNLKLVLGLT